MTLTQISTKVLSKLAEEAGSSDWWDATTIQSHVNEIYRDIGRDTDLFKFRDTNTTSVAGTARYVIPKPTGVDSIKKILAVYYNTEPIDPFTIRQLDEIDYRWRSTVNGTPWGWYFESGDENKYISFIPTPSDALRVDFECSYIPSELAVGSTPLVPFDDGIILIDGALSMALAMPGGGRDLDRSDYYFQRFLSHFQSITAHKLPQWRGFRSIDETGYTGGRVKLPYNYPKYSFD